MVIMRNPLEGQYDVWIGSYSSGDSISGTLYFTELNRDSISVER